MPKDLTLLIGAGASKDIHSSFGLGIDLLNAISNALEPKLDRLKTNENTELRYNLQRTLGISEIDIDGFYNNLYYYKRFKSPESSSIDEFLSEIETFPEYANWRESYLTIGIMSIYFFILKWEKEINDIPEKKTDFFKKTWIQYLIDFIEKNKLLDSYGDDPVQSQSSLMIVTFNYDRIIEFALMEYAKENNVEPQMKKWISSNISHVYGKVEELDTYPFGFDLKGLNYKIRNIIYHDGIMTTYNHRNKYKLQVAIKANNINYPIINATAGTLIMNSGQMVGFGFGFDFYNCRYLGILSSDINTILYANIFIKPENGNFEHRRVEIHRIRKMFSKIEFRYVSCSELMNEFLNNK